MARLEVVLIVLTCFLGLGPVSATGSHLSCPQNRNSTTNECSRLSTETVYTTCYVIAPCSSGRYRLCRYLRTCRTFRYTCIRQCCSGYVRNKTTDTCEKKTYQCDVDCLNGGTCIRRSGRKDKCSCPTGYKGRYCHKVDCPSKCKNGGVCDRVNNISKCVCPSNFTGSQCQTPQCNGGCTNGGLCRAVGYSVRCICPDGYTGNRCQHEIKDGDCPDMLDQVGTCINGCEYDSQCSGVEKCCKNGCGTECMLPLNHTCDFRGVRYAVGDTFLSDACTTCTCLTPNHLDTYGGAECVDTVCPPLERCLRSTYINSKCCPICLEHEPLPTTTTVAPKPNTEYTRHPPISTAVPKPDTEYTLPRFTNCPEDVIILHLPTQGRTVDMKFVFHAFDYKNRSLGIMLSKKQFQWVNSENGNLHPVMATSTRDVRDNFAVCRFMIQVHDPHKPTFDSCPADINTQEPDNTVEWDEPMAADNIGLVGPPTADHDMRKPFRLGDTIVTYTAEDLAGNVAFCQFMVKVLPAERLFTVDQPSPNLHIGDDGPVPESMSVNIYIVVGSILGAIVISICVVLVVVFVLKGRSRPRVRRHRAAANQQPAMGFDNAIYSVAGLPPPYTVVAKDQMKGDPCPTYDNATNSALSDAPILSPPRYS